MIDLNAAAYENRAHALPTTADNFSAIAGLLSCPDDGAPLSYDSAAVICSSCAHRFAIHAGNFAEILPRQRRGLPASVNPAYHHGYLQAFEQIPFLR